MAIHKGIIIHQYLDGESHIPPGLSPAYTRSSENMQILGWLVNLEKFGTGTKSRSSTL